MSCTKCQSLPSISTNGGEVIISCDVIELATKMAHFLETEKINYNTQDSQTLMVSVECFESFLQHLCLAHLFNKLEREGIHLLFLKDSQILTPSLLKEMKSLQKYKDLMGAAELSNLNNKGALTTHFQPIVDLKSDTIYGYESLARGVSDEGIERLEEVAFCSANGADLAQGYYFGRPNAEPIRKLS